MNCHVYKRGSQSGFGQISEGITNMPGDDFGIIGETKKIRRGKHIFQHVWHSGRRRRFPSVFPSKPCGGHELVLLEAVSRWGTKRDEIDVKSFMMNVRMERCSLLLSHRAYVYNQNQNDNTCQIETHITTLLTLKSNFALVSEYITYCSGIFALFKLRASLRWTGHMT